MVTPRAGGTSRDQSPRERHAAAKPSLDLLRSLTDEHLLRAVMEHGRLTRADIAARTGISKPTISESAKRLSAAGILVDTGERTSGRGRAGSYYSLSEAAGTALVIGIRPGGVAAETIDPYGATVTTTTIPLDRDVGQHQAARAMTQAAEQSMTNSAPFRLAVVSAADPVNRSSGRLVQLPDAPFMVGDLDPVGLLSPLVSGPTLVDNDVNWAARAERDASDALLDNFVYLHLDEGLGCAVVSDGEVNRGHQGMAGEIAHILTTGPHGLAMPLTEVFAALGARRPSSTAIDVERLRADLERDQPDGTSTLETVARAIHGVIVAAIALADPEQVVLGGTWGRDQRVVDAITHHLAPSPRRIPVRASQLPEWPDHAGARARALSELRTTIATRRDHPTALDLGSV
jgi:predicted NBD/HSP70 family sugar kinase